MRLPLSFSLLLLAACGGNAASTTGGGGGSATTTPPGTGGGASSSSSSSSGTAGTGGAGLVPVFVAQGHMGRTTISCDGGKSWIHNHSLDDSIRCFEPLDCDHNEGAGRGLAFGNGVFVATFGWGEPGELQRSADAVTWETVVKPAPNFADVAFGNGTFIANAEPPQLSTDGKTWTDSPAQVGLSVGNPRAIAFAEGVFVITGESGDQRDIVVSADGGQTFSHPDSLPPDCVQYVRGVAGGKGTFVAASGNGFVCTSTDAGKTWTEIPLDDGLSSPPVFTGAEFMVWNRATLHRSADGITWSSQPASPSSVSIGPVARSADGVFVASNDGWLAWYEKQEFYRSTDGVSWEVLDKSKFTGSHPINFIEFGLVPPSADCPAP